MKGNIKILLYSCLLSCKMIGYSDIDKKFSYQFDSKLMSLDTLNFNIIMEHGLNVSIDQRIAACAWYCQEEISNMEFKKKFAEVKSTYGNTSFVIFTEAILNDIANPDVHQFRKKLEEAVAADKDQINLYALYELDGVYEVLQNQYDNRQLRQVLALNPSFHYAKEELATCLDYLSQCEERLALLRDAERHYTTRKLRYEISRSLLVCGKYEEFEITASGYANKFADPHVFILLSKYFREKKLNEDLSLKYSLAAVDADSSEIPCQLNLAVSYAWFGRQREAETILMKLVVNENITHEEYERITLISLLVEIRYRNAVAAKNLFDQLLLTCSNPIYNEIAILLMNKLKVADFRVSEDDLQTISTLSDEIDQNDLKEFVMLAGFET